MVRILLAAAGAVVGLVLGAMLRPSMFGEPVPFDVLVSSHPMDAPFRTQILQTFSLTILGGVAVALLLGHLLRRPSSGVRAPRR
jgi:hypothetical protein